MTVRGRARRPANAGSAQQRERNSGHARRWSRRAKRGGTDVRIGRASEVASRVRVARRGRQFRCDARFDFEQSDGTFAAALLREDTRDPLQLRRGRFVVALGFRRFVRGATRRLLRLRAARGLRLLRGARRDQRADVFRRFDSARFGPGEFLFKREAAAVASPAQFRRDTAARVALTRVRNRRGLGGLLRHEHRRASRRDDLREHDRDRQRVARSERQKWSRESHRWCGACGPFFNYRWEERAPSRDVPILPNSHTTGTRYGWSNCNTLDGSFIPAGRLHGHVFTSPASSRSVSIWYS